MLYREIIAVCSQIHTKHINTLWGQNVDIGMLNLAVHINNCVQEILTKSWSPERPTRL